MSDDMPGPVPVRLTDFVSYADAQRRFSKPALWALFDGDRTRLNIAHECVDRHDRDRIAIRIALADGGETAIRFGELADWSGRFANWLVRRGVRPGERVAIMLEPSLLFYAALFGAMKAGAVAVPLFTLFGPDALRPRLADCRPALLLLTPDRRELAGIAGVETVPGDEALLAALAGEERGFAPATGARDMALYQYTSGTTRALPEAVRHPHQAVVTVAIAALYATGARPGDRFMCPSSPAWGHGLAHGTLGPLGLGVSIASYAGRFDPDRLMRAIQDFAITNLSCAATHYRMMRTAGTAHRYRFRVEKLSFTGEPIDSETADWAERTFGHPVCSIYGSTEVGVLLGNYPGAPDLPVRRGSLGKPLPGCEVAVLDGDGRPCAPGAVGEIMLRRGRGGWFRVKDRGHTDDDGYFYHDGRADDVIISAGWTMSAIEIEDVLLQHPDIDEAAAIGVADAQRGQVVKAFIVSRRPGGAGFVREIQDFARQRLSRHQYPRRVAFVAALPKTPAGKVNRQRLRAGEAVGTAP